MKEFINHRIVIMGIAVLLFITGAVAANGQSASDIKAEPVKDDDFDVKQNADNTLTITGYKGTARNVVIPDKLYGLKVTIIGSSAFQNKGLISVVIPDTVVTIEDGSYSGAFSSNKELQKVTLGKGLKTIGDYAFSGCLLTEIIIPDSVTRIGKESFNNIGLKNVTFGKGVQTIGDYAFLGNMIVELNLPSSLKEIGAAAFYNNEIQKITFGTGLQNIGSSAFRYNQITELNNLPSSLKTISGGAFANNQIQSLTIPNSVTSIGSWMYGDPEYSGSNHTEGAFAGNPIKTIIILTSFANGNISEPFNDYSWNYEWIVTKITTFTRITIPAKMDEKILKDNFEEAFVNFWISQNRAGGTYVKRGPIWTKE